MSDNPIVHSHELTIRFDEHEDGLIDWYADADADADTDADTDTDADADTDAYLDLLARVASRLNVKPESG